MIPGGIFMKIRSLMAFVFILTVLNLFLEVESKEIGWHVSGKRGVVVAGPEGSAEAGLEMLVKGGNAADAAVATILALSVVDSGGFCFGSEVPILIYEAERGVVDSISGMGVAPALATREYFQKAGGIKGRTSASAAVPAVLDACLVLLDRYGTMKFADVTEPVLRILDRNEKTWHSNLAATLRRLIQAEKCAEERKQGLRLVSDYFYRGPIAREIDTWSRANGGLIRYSDLATHITRVEEPVKVTYRGYTVYKCNTWTQGPYLLQALKLLEGFDFKSMGFQTPDTIHAIVESMKLAMADRDAYYGDPLFEDVPLQQLLSDEYSRLRRELINMRRASMTLQPGDPVASKPLRNEKLAGKGLSASSNDTTTCLVADRFGNVIAATPSGWGGVLAGNTGIWLGSRLISFNTWRGHPNCIQPGKRPRITLTPTIVLKDGKPVLAVSIAGGDTQDQATLQIVTNYIDFGLSPDKLITTPRYATHHYIGSFNQTQPILGGLTISTRMGKDIIRQLKARGHVINPNNSTGHVAQLRTVVVIGTESGVLHGAGDPNANPMRSAAAF
jgi:gamma-glutamyltranspeptidase/glutathione hydrolase